MYFAIQDHGLGIDKTTAMSIMSVYGALIYMSLFQEVGLRQNYRDTWCNFNRCSFNNYRTYLFKFTICNVWPIRFYVLIIVGSGLMKPNISNIVGRLYPQNDVRMDAGFVIFYMSVNFGALVSPIILQHFINVRNFHGGFLIAAIGMALGLVWYVLFNRKI